MWRPDVNRAFGRPEGLRQSNIGAFCCTFWPGNPVTVFHGAACFPGTPLAPPWLAHSTFCLWQSSLSNSTAPPQPLNTQQRTCCTGLICDVFPGSFQVVLSPTRLRVCLAFSSGIICHVAAVVRSSGSQDYMAVMLLGMNWLKTLTPRKCPLPPKKGRFPCLEPRENPCFFPQLVPLPFFMHQRHILIMLTKTKRGNIKRKIAYVLLLIFFKFSNHWHRCSLGNQS